MKHYLLPAIVCLFVSGTLAQSFKYRNYNFEWATGRPAPIDVEEQFKNEDAVILDEKLIYNAAGNRVPPYLSINTRANYFYIDESYNTGGPVIQRHVRIKFLTAKGIKKFSTFVLPESFDPSSDLSTIRPENRDSIYRPKGEFDCVRYFAARIIKPDGTIKTAILNESTQLETDRQNKSTAKLYNWIFRIINLEEDDELELDYSYENVFNVDPSSRIFFNGDIPKQNYFLTFRYPFEDYNVVTYANGALPYDSVMETKSRPKYTEYYFTQKNLPGGIRETGGRPYTQFPYISYYKHLRDFGIMDPKTKFIVKPLPYPWSYTLLPLVNYQYESLRLRLARKDQTTVALNNFLSAEKDKTGDTSFAGIMTSVQHTLSTEFDFKKDRDYYEGDDAELEHLGKYVANKTLREISRHRVYEEVFTRLDRDYFSALFCDKRISEIDINEYKNSTSFRTGFVVPYNNRFIFLYPKSYRCGYEANELPFYYEDINTVLIPQHEPSEKKYDFVPIVDFTFVKTPFSSVKDNTRMTNALVTVSLDSLSLSFSARIKLSGQFSTLLRGYYLYGDVDSTVNPVYFQTIGLLADENKHAEVSVTSTSKVYPYDASVSVNMSNHSALTKGADGNYSINMDGWFNNIIDYDYTAVNRHLNYYPDFQFQDSHKYMLKFDHKVQLLNPELFQNKIVNGFAEYVIKYTQAGEESILIETSYIVKPEYAPAEHAADVVAVFDAIKKLNASSLKISVQ